MKILHFVDLTDTNFAFECDFAGDGVDYFDYDLIVKYRDEKYYQSLSRSDIEQLRDNCKRILNATRDIE